MCDNFTPNNNMQKAINQRKLEESSCSCGCGCSCGCLGTSSEFSSLESSNKKDTHI